MQENAPKLRWHYSDSVRVWFGSLGEREVAMAVKHAHSEQILWRTFLRPNFFEDGPEGFAPDVLSAQTAAGNAVADWLTAAGLVNPASPTA